MAKDKNGPKVFLLTKYEQYLINNHEFRIIAEDQLCKGFIANVVVPRLGLDLSQGSVEWDTQKGELTYYSGGTKNEPSATKDKPTEAVGEKPEGNKGE